MSITRTFLGLERPALPAAAEYLLHRFGTPAAVDLRDVVVVLPGSRAGRRLLEILVDRAAANRQALTPPQIVTVGQLPELLYRAKKPFADDLVQQLVWADVLRHYDPAKLAAVVADRPEDGDTERWLALGRLLQGLHRELASDRLDFSDVARLGETLPGFAETDRWRTLAEMQRRYLASLDRLELWDRQTARLFAIEHGECRTDRPIILVAAVDLNRSMRQMLDQVADQVTALIYAPEDWRDRFDEHGCLLAAAWQNIELNIPESSLLRADHPAHQSELVVRRIAEFNGRFRAEEITVGVPDERLVAPLVRQLDECQLPNRYGPGQPVSRTGVYRMLEDLAAFARSGRYPEFAQLLRHPDIEGWLLRCGVPPRWIEELDQYYNEHLPARMDGVWLGDQEAHRALRAAFELVERLAGPLRGGPRPLDQWLPQIGRIILEVYGGRSFDLERDVDRRAWKACTAAQEGLVELARIPAAVMPTVHGPEALRLLLDRIGGQRMAPAASEAAIDLVGWLELPLDDAPALIVTSFNEGFVPSSVNADMFLPGRLRSALGLDDNLRRYARDAYAVATLLAPWRDATFLVAQRDVNDDPLAPSRLLFAAPPETVAQRALRFFDEAPAGRVEKPLCGGMAAARPESAFEVPRPHRLPEPITRMSVTSFKAYLACPYRFYLAYVLRLRPIDDDATELDGAGFGELAHDVLEQFGRGETRHATEAETIARELNHLLDVLARQRFGTQPSAALRVQIEQLRLRLQALARWQAEWAAQGWRISTSSHPSSNVPGNWMWTANRCCSPAGSTASTSTSTRENG